MFDGVGVAILVALVVVFGAITTGARRTRRPVLKWGGLLLGIPLTLVAIVATGMALAGFYHLNATHSNPVSNIKVASTPEQLTRGEQLANICVGCHSSNGQLPLGGQNFARNSPPVGTIYAANLTPIHLQSWSDGEIIRAIREGVHKSGRSLLFMPSSAFHAMSDDDVQALVAYLRAQPPGQPDTPATRINVVGAILSNVLPLSSAQAPIGGPVVAPPEGATPAYGRYLSAIGGCMECHGPALTGGASGQGPAPGPDLTMIARNWNEDDFIKTIRTGVTPSGHQLSAGMPWKEISAFTSNNDLRAIYAYLGKLSAPAHK